MRWIVLLLVLILSACDQPDLGSRTAGGSAVEGETITTRLSDPKGLPLVKIWFKISSPDLPGWEDQYLSSDSGTVTATLPVGLKTLVLECSLPDYPGQILVFRIRVRSSLDTTLSSQKWGALSGRVVAATGWKTLLVRVPDAAIQVPADSGTYSIAHVPPGRWSFLLVADSSGTTRNFDLGMVVVPSGGEDLQQDLSVMTDFVLLRDFEEMSTDSIRRVDCFRNDPGETGPAWLATACAGAATGRSAWSGSSLRLTLTGSVDTLHGARILFDSIRVSKSDSLVLIARGTGLLDLGWSPISAIDSFSQARCLLKPTWTRFAIPVASLPGDSLLPDTRDGFEIRSSGPTWAVIDQIELVRVRE